jgi:hypothetical protein
MVGALCGVFFSLGIVATVENRGAWPVLAVAGGAALYLTVKLLFLRLQVSAEGIRYRTLGADRAFGYADIERGFFTQVVNRAAPQGVRTFWIRPKQGKPMQIDLRSLPVRAATVLYGALQRHGIPIDVPEPLPVQKRRPGVL